MKPAVKQLWVDALRSGNYQQTYTKMYVPEDKADEETPAGYCCLGVLGKLYCEATGTDFDTYLAKCDNEIPGGNDFAEWAGVRIGSQEYAINGTFLCTYNPTVKTSEEFPKIQIAELNDRGDTTFAQLADIIEAQL